MQDINAFLNIHSQNRKLAIRLITPDFGHLPPSDTVGFGLKHRKPHYFFLFMLKGTSSHGVDLEQFEVKSNELLFILPHQIHRLPETKEAADYFKLGFDEECLAKLPRRYYFLIAPFNNQKIQFSPHVAARIKSIFENLKELLASKDANPEIVLAYLSTLLTEIDASYFAKEKRLVDDKLSKYIAFKRYVEENFKDHLPVEHIAENLAVNTNTLYNLVKHYSGMSPKKYITHRLMLEAKRRLYYAESSSIKELAYHLGYSDPEYFSRLFKMETGKTITDFTQDLSGN